MNVRTCIRIACLTGLLVSFLSGCTSLPEDEKDRPLTLEELRTLLVRAKDPRELWITVYQGKSGPVFENTFRVKANQGAWVPFVGDTNAPPMVMAATLRSEGIPALVDPSSPDSWASLSMANGLSMIPIGPPYYQVEPGHLNTEDKGIIAYLRMLKLETAYIDSPLFVIRGATGGLEEFKRGAEDPEPVLVLGNNFLRTFKFVQFNFLARRLVIATSDEYRETRGRVLSRSSLITVDGALATEAMVNGRKTTVLLDPAGNYTLAVAEEGMEDAYRISIGDLRLSGKHPVSTESLSLTESDYPRIGLQALKPYVMTLDYSNKIIWFERPAE